MFSNSKAARSSSSHNDTERINKILDIDDGARYLGEFSFGIDPYITRLILETLFDEKIAGSLHIRLETHTMIVSMAIARRCTGT